MQSSTGSLVKNYRRWSRKRRFGLWIPPRISLTVEQQWKKRGTNHLTGVTAFTASSSDSPEDSRVSELEDIDLHHGWYSSNPPYTIIEVIGATLSERIKAELALYGFNDFS